MLIDLQQVQEGSEFNVDLCILGGGACGIAIARTFNNSNVTIALVESGGFDYSAENNQLYGGEATGVDDDYLFLA